MRDLQTYEVKVLYCDPPYLQSNDFLVQQRHVGLGELRRSLADLCSLLGAASIDVALDEGNHELGSPLIVLVVDVVQGLDHVVEADRQVLAEVGLEERTAELPVQDRGIVDQEMISRKVEINK